MRWVRICKIDALPWSSLSAEHPYLVGCEWFVHVLPEQQYVEACDLLWWWSWGLLCAPAAASQAPCDPFEQHNEEVFGHPGQEERVFLKHETPHVI